jgi:hypothetical protein
MRRGLGVLMAAGTVAGLAMFGLAPAASAATGATLYAAPTPVGNNDCLSAASACSLQKAIDQANNDSGDTVVLAGGAYNVNAAGGLSLYASMALTAAPGQLPILSAAGTASAYVIQIFQGTTSVSGLTLSGGLAGIIAISNQPLTVTGSTISGNGIGMVTTGSTTVTGSTISGNTDGLDVSASTMSVTDSTITGNTDVGVNLLGAVSLTAVGVTLSDNRFAGISVGGGSASVGSSLFARNGSGCSGGGVTDAGYNVESDNSCGFGASSQTGTGDAAIGLGTLASNGSPGPQTQAIDATSAAFHAVPLVSGLCAPAVDERGLLRPGTGLAPGAYACDAGAYEWQHLPGTLTQAAPTSGRVTRTPFVGQLAVTGATTAAGPVTYTTTKSAAPVTVSPAGLVTAPGTISPGVYRLAGTTADPGGDTGTWTFTLTITTADLSAAITAPATATRSGPATVTVTITNLGPYAANKVVTYLEFPFGWHITNPDGGTRLRYELKFTDPRLGNGAAITYNVAFTAPSAAGQAVFTAVTGADTADPSQRNNFATATVQVS